MKTCTFAVAAVSAAITFASFSGSASAWVVSYEGERPGVENTTATFSVGGVETFSNQSDLGWATTVNPFTTDFGTSGNGLGTITGTYSGTNGGKVQINPADQYGGAGGKGHYIVAFRDTPYTLTLTSTVSGGINYFGYWLSALDAGNYVTFYGNNNQKLFTFNPEDVLAAVNGKTEYYGNPNSNFLGEDGGEPFIFLNFFDNTGTFSKVEFYEDPAFGGGYESDNHTVGHYVSMGNGTFIPLVNSVVSTPEPATWAMMLVGFACLGFAGYRTSRESFALLA